MRFESESFPEPASAVAGTFPDRIGRRQVVLGILVSALFAALRIWSAAIPGLEPDEAFSLRVTRQSWGELLSLVSQDVVHPPVFYFLLKLWMLVVGESVFFLRLLPTAMALLSIVPTYLLCRELGVRLPAANLAVFLAAVNPFLIRNGQGLRMYSMLLLLGMWSLWLVFRFCRTAPGSSRGPLVALTCVNLLMVYTHYLGWILIALEGAVVIAEARPKVGAFLVSTLCVGAGFAPWAAFVAIRSRPSVGLAEDVRQHLRWIERPDWRDVVSYFARLNGAFREGLGSAKVKVLVGFALFDLPLVLAFRNRARIAGIDAADAPSRRGSRALAWLAFFTAVPVAIALVVSHLLPFSIFGPRYLILSSIPYLILCAVGLVSVQPKVLRSVAIAAAMGWAVFGFVEEVRLVGRTDWFFLVGEMRRVEPEPQGPVDVFSLTSQSPVRYALQRDPDPRFRIRSRIAHVNEIDGPRFWLAFQESVAYPEETRALLHALEEKGYRRVHCLESGSPQNRMHLDRFVRSPGSAAPESLGPGSSP